MLCSCRFPRPVDVVSQGGSVIGTLCDKCGGAIKVMCPFCRDTFKDIDAHQTRAEACRDAARKAKAHQEYTDRVIAAQKAEARR